MLNRAPYNTEVPQFLPSRDAPINSYITRKYPCQEHLAGETNKFGTLTWKIQQPDLNMVFKTVKVVIPVKIKAQDRFGNVVSMKTSDKLPACNVALSAHMQKAFTDIQLSLNGKIFTIQPSNYQELLDVCYVSKDADSFLTK